MRKEDLRIGMRVYAITPPGSYVHGIPGTIIDTQCRNNYDCLIEFDEFVYGHSGLGWGSIEGEQGRCYWFEADMVEEILDGAEISYNMSYYDFINCVVTSAEPQHT